MTQIRGFNLPRDKSVTETRRDSYKEQINTESVINCNAWANCRTTRTIQHIVVTTPDKN